MMGNTPYHLCYSVKDMGEAIGNLKNSGYALVEKPTCAVAFGSKKVAFLYSKHMGIIELLECNI